MQQNKKGSILLYTLFLSSFLVLFFVSFQGKLENILEGTQDSEQSVQDISSTQDALVLLKNNPRELTIIDSNQNLSLVSTTQNGTIFTESLSQTGSQEYYITSTGGANTISINITQGGPILYHLAAFNSGSEASANIISSGVIITNNIIDLSLILDTHILVVESLAGYVQYTLDTNITTIIPSSSSYLLERDINGYKQEEGIYNITNFLPKSRINFDYQKMGMYLKI